MSFSPAAQLSLALRKFANIARAFAFLALLHAASQAQEQPATITSLAALQEVAEDSPATHSFDLEATVWYVNPSTGGLILHDETSSAEVELDSSGYPFQPGDRIAIAGNGSLLDLGDRYQLTRIPFVDNDGLHGEEEQSGSIHLTAGRHPLRVEWFNAIGEPGLHLDYQGPGIEPDPVPNSVLFRQAATLDPSGEPKWQPGLDFRTYHERWWSLPPSTRIAQPVLTGHTENFDVTVTPRREFVAIEYTGYIEIAEPGEYTFFLRSDDGSRLYIGEPSLQISSPGWKPLPEARLLYPGQVLVAEQDYLWARLEGQVTHASRIGSLSYLTVQSGAGSMRVEIADATGLPWANMLHTRIRMTGVARRSRSLDGIPTAATLFAQNSAQIEILQGVPQSKPQPPAQLAVTPIQQIERFAPSLLDGQHTARVQGVVINSIPGGYAIVIQDAERAMFIDLNRLRPEPFQLGDLLDITGLVQPGEFSPFIDATELTRLGSGILPAPVEATRDELINGSLHSQYVEIDGYVLAVDERTVTLRTRAGVLNIDLETETSTDWLNSILRLRGCLRSFWDPESREVEVGKIELNSAEIAIVRPAPNDLFDVSKKRVSELLKFDPNASVFQRVGLTGQILQTAGDRLYLIDQEQGVRVTLATPLELQRGDFVEVAGFPEFTGPSPHFAHAIARKVGHEPLPPAHLLPADALLSDDYDSTLVSVDGDLIGIGFQSGHRTLQLRAGANVFSASIANSGEQIANYEPGSQLRLTGVYAGLGGNRSLGQPIEAFEILLASPSDVQVLVTPPWWTMPRLLTLMGALSIILLIALLWIKALERQVAARTAELREVLQERHRVQQEEALARERSRMAHDLHDELGAGLTEVGLLGTLAATHSLPIDKRDSHLSRLSDKVRGLVMALDEIVWAVNPKYDSVSSFVDYFTSYAQQFLELANVRCRFDVADELPVQPLTSRVRHSLFLAFKETLTNVARHADASEVIVRIYPKDTQLVLSVSDNGCGLQGKQAKPSMNGLDNIRDRLSEMGGHCTMESDEQTGTTVTLKLPLK
ncbi:ATPase, histidine kinase-, DNA gyrase B-, and HSP90-like domain protein [Verrucomicrobiia bacterium DG1235]|nr:ATPase, histidine kinase-, DNA gyrase B-, and HSP90-like domain protein [Verrucomicrobiae bacterium DG1235]